MKQQWSNTRSLKLITTVTMEADTEDYQGQYGFNKLERERNFILEEFKNFLEEKGTGFRAGIGTVTNLKLIIQ